MGITYAEGIAQCAEHIAGDDSHGYSQPNRRGNGTTEALAFSGGAAYSVHGGDMDCSEMVKECVVAVGLMDHSAWMHTRNEDGMLRGAGFRTVPLGSKRRGDVLWKTGHTGIYLGGGLMADAHGDEWGGIDGPAEGDQTGHEIEVRPVSSCSWELCYRAPSGEIPGTAGADVTIANGIDVSNWQGEGGAAAIRDTACGFAIVKASEGDWYADAYAAANAEAALSAGKLLGFYHYAGTGAAEAEADWFVARCREAGHLDEATLWLDYEGEALGNGPSWCERFMARVDALAGKTCGIYTSQSVTESQDFGASTHRPLWVAQYASDAPVYGWQDDPWSSGVYGAWGSSCAIHQYTGDGHVAGYDGPLDLDRGHFTAAQWSEWAGGSRAGRGQDDDGTACDRPSDAAECGERGYDEMAPTAFTFGTDVRIRTAPSTSAPLAPGTDDPVYHVGQTVVVDGIALGDGYVWGHYVGAASGEDRWVALGRTSFVSAA